jgi:GNAT superfamily N-acetyltransferase
MHQDLFPSGGNAFFGLHSDLRLTYRQSRPEQRKRVVNAMIWEGSPLPLERYDDPGLHELWRGDELVGLFAIDASLLGHNTSLEVKAHLGICYLIEELRGQGIGREVIMSIASQLTAIVRDTILDIALPERLPIQVTLSADVHNRRGELITDVFCEQMMLTGDLVRESGLVFRFDARDCL